MNPIKSTLFASILFIGASKCFAQKTDSIPGMKRDSIARRTVAFAADKFAVARPLNIEFTHAAPYNYSSKLEGTPLPNGRINTFTQARIGANVNFIKRKTWMLGVTAGYRYTKAQADNMPASGGLTFRTDENFSYLFSSLNFTYFSSLFKKRMIYSSSFLVDGSEKHFERIKGIFTGTMVLKANQRTKMTAGVLVNIDQSAQSPIIPTFSYEHKFNNGLIADIVLPRSIYLRKYMFGSGRASIGTELDRTSFYVYDIDGTAQRYEYRQLDINSGLTYEHAIGKYFVLSAKTGMKYSPSGRLFKKEESFASPVLEISPDPTFFFNVGISFNPFTVLTKKGRSN
ncbi:hypothetical protein EZ456_13070 [Pedobacter psychrodurus]|uniref:Uncharacterized protein n=1 Tax=Pedobacter psychrodurus TaxID=2530456 RepID=A0A4R0PVA9_9SPHI|nr:hypothetical protein [Pedobacter psychrodurus]TCD26519.1 hypothetical protein EZ456_13070 [Pedobacter psychrodurus]